MNEILNIHSQLTDMLAERNYHVNNKYNYNDIIKCVCSGLKQYICNKTKKGRITYNSPTEREIRIHPGSFLFGENPSWIVGGNSEYRKDLYQKRRSCFRRNCSK